MEYSNGQMEEYSKEHLKMGNLMDLENYHSKELISMLSSLTES